MWDLILVSLLMAGSAAAGNGLDEDVAKRIWDFRPADMAGGSCVKAAQSSGSAPPTQIEHENGDRRFCRTADGNSGVIVAFDTEPSGAVVLLDGRILCQSTPCSKLVESGSHRLEFHLESYLPERQDVTICEGTGTVRRILTPDFGWLTVRSTPTGVELTLDGKPSGTTPIERLQVSSGPHRVSVSAPRHDDMVMETIVARGAHEEIDVELVADENAALLAEGGGLLLSPGCDPQGGETFRSRLLAQKPDWAKEPTSNDAVGVSALQDIERAQRQAYFKAVSNGALSCVVRTLAARPKVASETQVECAGGDAAATAAVAKLQFPVSGVDWWVQPGSEKVYAFAKVPAGLCERAVNRALDKQRKVCRSTQDRSAPTPTETGHRDSRICTAGWSVLAESSEAEAKAGAKLRAVMYALQQLGGAAEDFACSSLSTTLTQSEDDKSESPSERGQGESLSRSTLKCYQSTTLPSEMVLDWMYKTYAQTTVSGGEVEHEAFEADVIRIRC